MSDILRDLIAADEQERKDAYERGLAKGREEAEERIAQLEASQTQLLEIQAMSIKFADDFDKERLARIRQLEEALRKAIDVFEGMNDDEINEELLPELRAALRAEPAAPAGGEQRELIHADDARADAFNVPPPGSDRP